MEKIASSETVKGLEKLINEFYYSENWVVLVNEMMAFNPKTGKRLGKVEFKNNRYTYYA